MKYREVGGVRLSTVGLGTWQFGSREWGYGPVYATGIAPELVHRSLELGVNLFDTAEIYGFGRSERILGEALVGRRDDAFIATKLFPLMPVDPIVTRRARLSAGRLGIDVIDLYQVHWPNPVVPLSATMGPLARLQRDGMVRHLGVSNFPLGRWKNAEELVGGPVLSNQVRYNLADRRIEREVLPWAQEHGRVVIAYSPLQQGLLSGRYGPDNLPKGMRANTSDFLLENLRRIEPLLGVLRRVAEAHGASASQVSLAWLLRRPNVVVIPGASSLAQAESNAEAADLELTDAEDEELTVASDAYSPIRGPQSLGPLAKGTADRLGERLRGIGRGLRA
jgi:aryl-alcohol dehydrogenase-like predicted oxidoreductase